MCPIVSIVEICHSFKISINSVEEDIVLHLNYVVTVINLGHRMIFFLFLQLSHLRPEVYNKFVSI